jgi:multisubunit Na+/H+ antiporter MnhB subunit
LKEEDTEGYKVIGLIFLALAVILLLNATVLNPRESQWGLVLFIFGVILLFLGGIISNMKTESEKEHACKQSKN